MFPFASHEEYGYKLASFASEVLAEAGKLAAEMGHSSQPILDRSVSPVEELRSFSDIALVHPTGLTKKWSHR